MERPWIADLTFQQLMLVGAFGLVVQSVEGSSVSRHSMVGVVVPKLLVDGPYLLTHWQMSVLLAPLGGAAKCSLQACFHRL